MKSHPKAGEPTHFVEKIIAGMLQNPAMKNHQSLCGYDNLALMDCHLPKSTTIREGKTGVLAISFHPVSGQVVRTVHHRNRFVTISKSKECMILNTTVFSGSIAIS
jgi:hypothetical protein